LEQLAVLGAISISRPLPSFAGQKAGADRKSAHWKRQNSAAYDVWLARDSRPHQCPLDEEMMARSREIKPRHPVTTCCWSADALTGMTAIKPRAAVSMSASG